MLPITTSDVVSVIVDPIVEVCDATLSETNFCNDMRDLSNQAAGQSILADIMEERRKDDEE